MKMCILANFVLTLAMERVPSSSIQITKLESYVGAY